MRRPSARPFRRSLIRLALRLCHGRRRAHAQDWWPGLELSGTPPAEVRHFGRALCHLHPLAELLPGLAPAVTLIGSGPSLRGQAVEALGVEPVLCLNGALTLRHRLRGPVILVVEDERFIWRHLDFLRDHLSPGDACVFSTEVLRALAEAAPDLLAALRVSHVDNLLKPYRSDRRSTEDPSLPLWSHEGGALSLEPAKGVMPAGTVAFTALQIALAAKPERVGLAGIDLGGGGPRFYESGAGAWSGLDADAERLLAQFAAAKAWADGQGIALECYAPGSRLLSLDLPFVDRLGLPGPQGSATEGG